MRPFALLIPALLLAQSPAAAEAVVSGIVKDSVTGRPLAGYNVSTSVNATWVGNTFIQAANTRTVQSTTDATGRYRLAGLPAGAYRIVARDAQRFGSQITRHVTLSGHDMDSFDFIVKVDGGITGKVVDQNKEPVPGLTVMLVSREYYLGGVGYFPRVIGRTDDRGIYTLDRVAAGQPWLLVAGRGASQLPARSEAPLDPKLRKPVPMRTWYPNSPDKEGAAPVTVQPGELREGVDIEIRKSANFCAEGEAGTPTGPAALRFMIEALQPSSGISPNGGMFMAPTGGLTGPDGKFRVCDLAPGPYRFTLMPTGAAPNQPPPGLGVSTIAISDRDIRNLKLFTLPGTHVEAEVVWDSTPTEEPVTATISFSLMPLLRTQFQGESNNARIDIPGTSTLSVFLDDYAIRAFFNIPGIYLKDIAYAGRSVQYEPIHFGATPGVGGFRIVLAHDGATIAARVSDKDGNPVPDSHVLIVPADAPSEAVLAAKLVSGQTDQLGQYTSITLAPGKYYVAATAETVGPTPEAIGKLWRARNRFKEVDLSPGGSTQLALVPVTLE